ncbi:MAG: hypothetical protein A3F83_08460 [Candidatus Glassbacteria bacterium RIFCSPLOWO2_12_FULL_58_11]|uniref:Glutamine--fructose-6-phosphate aminotransferase [isomerizing] n=1 Tax=Candidatus Glassbacteria bacterium RIFCSPLOWO2_12_FULL_58_11 TaxID=1817867 RepID=A0A1F5YY95_9BACT|nr:MAG: hypothetical protein A3F83_08460 [Candidatus Glassbacteria bacterium RIFCSPLOWO2_12_FULL_58_11]
MTRFLDEVDSQPAALLELAGFYRAAGAPLLKEWEKLLGRHSSLAFIGMGTSELAACLVLDALASLGKSVTIHDAGEYLHYLLEYSSRDRLYVLISQSGASAETDKVCRALAGVAPRVVLANEEKSPMALAADLFLPLKAGAERSISNKTYLNTLALLYLLAGGGLDKLEAVAGYLGHSCSEKEVSAAAEFLRPAESIHFIARGPALAAARQMALTFMEGAKCHGTAFAAGAFRHGPFEVLGENHRAVCLAPQGKTSALTLAMAREMASRGSRVVLLTDLEEIPEEDNLCVIRVKSFGEERLFPLALVVLQGHLLHHVAALRGYEAGVFRVVSKVTTVE